MRSFICALLLAIVFPFGCDDPTEPYNPLNSQARFNPIFLSDIVGEPVIYPSFGEHIELPNVTGDGWTFVCTHSAHMFNKSAWMEE